MQLEIMTETCMDCLSDNSGRIRKPLFYMIRIAVLLTMRSARWGISMTKNSGYGVYGSSYGSSSYGSPYGKKRKTLREFLGLSNNSMFSSSSSSYGGSYTGSQYNPNSPYGSAVGGSTSSQYGSTSNYLRGSTTPTSSYGSTTSSSSMYGNSSPTTSSFTSSGGGSSVCTANLVGTQGSNVQVVQGGLFHDYGMVTDFMGQVETVSTMEAPTFVEQILRSPGAGRVLVIDGGGSLNSAVPDASVASVAQQNGWKGIIVNGAVRNADSLKSSQIGVKAVGTHQSKGVQTMGQRGAPVSFGGVNISPGNYIYADTDGIVVSMSNLGGANTSSFSNTGRSYGASTPQYGGTTSTSQFGASTSSQIGGQYGGVNSQYGETNSQYGASTPQYNGGSDTQYGGSPSQYGGTNSQYGGASSQYAAGMNSQYGATSTYGSSSGYQGGLSRFSTSTYGRFRSKTSKKKLIAMLLLVCAIVWLLLGD